MNHVEHGHHDEVGRGRRDMKVDSLLDSLLHANANVFFFSISSFLFSFIRLKERERDAFFLNDTNSLSGRFIAQDEREKRRRPLIQFSKKNIDGTSLSISDGAQRWAVIIM